VSNLVLPRMAAFATLLLGLGGLACCASAAVAGLAGLEGAVWATGLCLLPGLLVLGIEPLFRSPQGQVAVMLVGTLIRVAVAAGGALAVDRWRTDVPRGPFLASLVVLYLASLTWETVVLSRRTASPQPPSA